MRAHKMYITTLNDWGLLVVEWYIFIAGKQRLYEGKLFFFMLHYRKSTGVTLRWREGGKRVHTEVEGGREEGPH